MSAELFLAIQSVLTLLEQLFCVKGLETMRQAFRTEGFGFGRWFMNSACKSSLGTAKKLGLDQTWTGSGPEIPRTGKDRNRGPVFGLSLFRNFED